MLCRFLASSSRVFLAGWRQSQTIDNAPLLAEEGTPPASDSASASPSESSTETQNTEPSEKATEKPVVKPSERSPYSALADAYEQVFDDPTAYKFNHPDPYMPSDFYSYALAHVTGDGLPELLLQADVTDYFAPVTVFGKPAGKKLFNARQILIAGTGSGGGAALTSMFHIRGTGSIKCLNLWHIHATHARGSAFRCVR